MASPQGSRMGSQYYTFFGFPSKCEPSWISVAWIWWTLVDFGDPLYRINGCVAQPTFRMLALSHRCHRCHRSSNTFQRSSILKDSALFLKQLFQKNTRAKPSLSCLCFQSLTLQCVPFFPLTVSLYSSFSDNFNVWTSFTSIVVSSVPYRTLSCHCTLWLPGLPQALFLDKLTRNPAYFLHPNDLFFSLGTVP